MLSTTTDSAFRLCQELMVTFDRNFGSKCKEHLVKARQFGCSGIELLLPWNSHNLYYVKSRADGERTLSISRSFSSHIPCTQV